MKEAGRIKGWRVPSAVLVYSLFVLRKGYMRYKWVQRVQEVQRGTRGTKGYKGVQRGTRGTKGYKGYKGYKRYFIIQLNNQKALEGKQVKPAIFRYSFI